MTEPYRFPPVGRCIYCGATQNLSDEHIVPYALGGRLILPKSSCPACAKITSSIEHFVARKMYGTLRLKYNFPTRHPKQRPKDVTVMVGDGADRKPVTVPIAAPPGVVPFVHFKPPGFLRKPPVREVADAVENFQLRFLPHDWSYWKPAKKTGWSPTQSINVFTLARFLAKMAHAYCVATCGIDSFEHWLTPIILGKDTNFGYLVGGLSPYLTPLLDLNNRDKFQLEAVACHYAHKDILIAYIWYFGGGGNSPDCVVVGKASKELMQRLHEINR